MGYRRKLKMLFGVQIICEQIRQYTLGILSMEPCYMSPEEVTANPQPLPLSFSPSNVSSHPNELKNTVSVQAIPEFMHKSSIKIQFRAAWQNHCLARAFV
jgi:hypothetical protein